MGVIILLFIFPYLILTGVSLILLVIYSIRTGSSIEKLNDVSDKQFVRNVMLINWATSLPAYIFFAVCLYYMLCIGGGFKDDDNLNIMTFTVTVTNVILPLLGLYLTKLYSKRKGKNIRLTTISLISRGLLIIGGSGCAFLAACSVPSNFHSFK